MSNEPIKVVTEEGLRILWNQISLDDYPNNDLLIAVLDGIDATKADKTEVADAKQKAIDAAAQDATDKDAIVLSEAQSYADGIKNDLLNGAGEAYDTLKELGELIDENHDAIDALEIVATGKADKVHTHEIADVNELQAKLTALEESIAQKTQVQFITWEEND